MFAIDIRHVDGRRKTETMVDYRLQRRRRHSRSDLNWVTHAGFWPCVRLVDRWIFKWEMPLNEAAWERMSNTHTVYRIMNVEFISSYSRVTWRATCHCDVRSPSRFQVNNGERINSAFRVTHFSLFGGRKLRFSYMIELRMSRNPRAKTTRIGDSHPFECASGDDEHDCCRSRVL